MRGEAQPQGLRSPDFGRGNPTHRPGGHREGAGGPTPGAQICGFWKGNPTHWSGGHREGAGDPTPGTQICGFWKGQSHPPTEGSPLGEGRAARPQGAQICGFRKGQKSHRKQHPKSQGDRSNPRVEVSGLKPRDDFVTLSNFIKVGVLIIGIFREDDVLKTRFLPSPRVRALLDTHGVFSTGYFGRHGVGGTPLQ